MHHGHSRIKEAIMLQRLIYRHSCNQNCSASFQTAYPRRQFNYLILQVSTSTSTHITHTKSKSKAKANHRSLHQVTGACKRVNNEHSSFIHTCPLSGIVPASPPHIHFQLFLTTGEVPSATKVSFILFITSTHSGGEHFYFKQITYPIFHSNQVLKFAAFDRQENATPIL